jgi:hypothetical protein
MQRVHFCSGAVFMTGDRIAEALLTYAGAVATLKKFAVLALPIESAPGLTGTMTLLLNNSSQLSAESVLGNGPELIDDDFVRQVESLTATLMALPIWAGEDPAVV